MSPLLLFEPVLFSIRLAALRVRQIAALVAVKADLTEPLDRGQRATVHARTLHALDDFKGATRAVDTSPLAKPLHHESTAFWTTHTASTVDGWGSLDFTGQASTGHIVPSVYQRNPKKF